MTDKYFTLVRMNRKEYPCNRFTKRWGWLIRLYKKGEVICQKVKEHMVRKWVDHLRKLKQLKKEGIK